MGDNIMSKAVAQSAGRALGLIIAKSKAYGGIPYECFTKLYNALVIPIFNYGAAIWGTREFTHVNGIHNRACRFFLGLGKSAPTAAAQGDMGWPQLICQQWSTVTRLWCKMAKMSVDRINKKVFLYCTNKAGGRCQNWCFRVKKFYNKVDLGGLTELADVAECSTKLAAKTVHEVVFNSEKAKWLQTVNMQTARRGAGLNKLRTYNKFKQVFEVESYVLEGNMSRGRRSALAKFRCGVAPIRLETGRYENLSVDQRVCPFCATSVEDESHVILDCQTYADIRAPLVQAAFNINPLLRGNDNELLHFILSNDEICTLSAKTLFRILKCRREMLYST